jgi:hypothetical protein
VAARAELARGLLALPALLPGAAGGCGRAVVDLTRPALWAAAEAWQPRAPGARGVYLGGSGPAPRGIAILTDADQTRSVAASDHAGVRVCRGAGG